MPTFYIYEVCVLQAECRGSQNLRFHVDHERSHTETSGAWAHGVTGIAPTTQNLRRQRGTATEEWVG